MSRQVITAVMLDDLRRTGAEIRLPKGGLVTPAARDWLKESDLPVQWVEETSQNCSGSLAVVMDSSLPEMRAMRTMLERDGLLAEVIEPQGGSTSMAVATGLLCGKIIRQEAAKGVVFAQDGAVPVCVANKHNGIRSALGVNVLMVDQACRELGMNVLVIEYPNQTTYQIKQMVDRLVRGATKPQPETAEVISRIEGGVSSANR